MVLKEGARRGAQNAALQRPQVDLVRPCDDPARLTSGCACRAALWCRGCCQPAALLAEARARKGCLACRHSRPARRSRRVLSASPGFM